jgi:hypothetical protein
VLFLLQQYRNRAAELQSTANREGSL